MEFDPRQDKKEDVLSYRFIDYIVAHDTHSVSLPLVPQFLTSIPLCHYVRSEQVVDGIGPHILGKPPIG